MRDKTKRQLREVKRLHAKGLHIHEMTGKLGVSKTRIHQLQDVLKLQTNYCNCPRLRRGRLIHPMRVVALRQNHGLPMTEIADELGCTRARVSQILLEAKEEGVKNV